MVDIEEFMSRVKRAADECLRDAGDKSSQAVLILVQPRHDSFVTVTVGTTLTREEVRDVFMHAIADLDHDVENLEYEN